MTNKHVGPLWDHCVLARGVAHIPLHARQTVRTSHSLRAQSAGRNTKREQHEAAMGRDANNETMTQSVQFGKNGSRCGANVWARTALIVGNMINMGHV